MEIYVSVYPSPFSFPVNFEEGSHHKNLVVFIACEGV
jgi:hypothetical protein